MNLPASLKPFARAHRHAPASASRRRLPAVALAFLLLALALPSARASLLTLTLLNPDNTPNTNSVKVQQADTNQLYIVGSTITTIGVPVRFTPDSNGVVNIYRTAGDWAIYGPTLGTGVVYRFLDASSNATIYPVLVPNTVLTISTGSGGTNYNFSGNFAVTGGTNVDLSPSVVNQITNSAQLGAGSAVTFGAVNLGAWFLDGSNYNTGTGGYGSMWNGFTTLGTNILDPNGVSLRSGGSASAITNIVGILTNNTVGNSATSTLATNLVGLATASIVTNLAGISTNENLQTWFSVTTFQVTTNTFSVWKYAGTTPTNLTLVSSNPMYVDSSVAQVRDPSHFKYTDNNGQVTYLLSYGAYPNLSETSMVGIATSPDDVNWTKLGYISFTNLGYNIAFSSKFHVNATNGLFMTVALGIDGIIPTNAFILDINPTNYLQYSNLRFINISADPDGAEQSAGDMLYYNGIYYYFDSDQIELTNSTLSTTGWGLAAGNVNASQQQSGPSVFNYNGKWYWFTSDQTLNYIYSTNLLTWYGAANQPFFSSPFANSISVLGSFQEGKFIVENYASTPPIFTGSIPASSVTGLTTNAITSGTNSVVVSSTNVVINIPATGNFSINVGGVSAFSVSNGVPSWSGTNNAVQNQQMVNTSGSSSNWVFNGNTTVYGSSNIFSNLRVTNLNGSMIQSKYGLNLQGKPGLSTTTGWLGTDSDQIFLTCSDNTSRSGFWLQGGGDGSPGVAQFLGFSWYAQNGGVVNEIQTNGTGLEVDNGTRGSTIPWTASTITANSFISTATNTVFAASSTGFTNGAGDLILCGVTGVGITRTNILSGQGFSYGTLTTPTDIFLTESNQIRATSGFNVLGFQSH